MDGNTMQTFENNSVERFLFDNHGVRGEIVKLKTPFEELLHKDYPSCLKKTMMEFTEEKKKRRQQSKL